MCDSTQNTHIHISATQLNSIQCNILYIPSTLNTQKHARIHAHSRAVLENICIRTFTFVTYCNYILFNVLNASCELFLFHILRASSIIIKLVVENIRYRFFTRFFSPPWLVILIDSPKKYIVHGSVCHAIRIYFDFKMILFSI